MERLPIYPVETFPDRPAFIVPAIGEAYDAEEVFRAIADAGYRVRQDLESAVSDTPGAEGWYVFVEGAEEHLGSSLGAARKKKKGASKKEKALARKAAKGGARRRKTSTGSRGDPAVRKFKAKGFNLKKMPLGIATQLIFAQIWPDAYKVSQDFPRVEVDPNDPPFLKDMDFNPHLYMNVEQAMEWSREGQADPSWKEFAATCAGTGEPPYVGLFEYAAETHGHGKSIERQIMETFDFPFEAQALMVRYERDHDDESYQELWEGYLTPYFLHLAYILDLMKTPEMTGYFNFTSQPQSEEWGLFYEECSSDESDDHGQHAPGGEPPRIYDDDEDDMDEPEEPAEEPEGGDLNEP